MPGENQEQYRELIEASPDPIVIYDLEGNASRINKAFSRTFGWSRDELLGKRIDFVPEENQRETRAAINTLFSDGIIQLFETRRFTKEGNVLDVQISASLFYDNNSKPVGTIVILRDVTDIKRIDKELKKTLEDLQNAQVKLIQSAKLASIGELASGVAHELNQPLMVIRTSAQLMLKRLLKDSFDRNKLEEKLKSIEKNTKRMMNIINHLRTFSRQSKCTFAPVDINRIIQDCFLMIGEQIRLQRIEVKMELSPSISMIQGDFNQLEQVVLNLISNARDAILSRKENAGAVKVQGEIYISTAVCGDDQDSVGILVKDNGCGIPEDVQQNIFNPFFTTKEVGKGTGLGLSISHGIIQDHNGEIEIAETGSEGTAFRIKLPVMNT